MLITQVKKTAEDSVIGNEKKRSREESKVTDALLTLKKRDRESKGIKVLPDELLGKIIQYTEAPQRTALISKQFQRAVNGIYPDIAKDFLEKIHLSHRLPTNFDTLSTDQQIKVAKNRYKRACEENDENLITCYKEVSKVIDQDNYDSLKLPKNLSIVKKAARVRAWMKDHADFLKEDVISLYLTNKKLTTLPSEITQYCSGLEAFSIANNRIRGLPPEIGDLSQLTKLTLLQNKLKKIPHTINKLINLEELEIGNNKLQNISTEISNCQNLTILGLSDNKELQTDFSQLRDLQNLESLDVSNSKKIKTLESFRHRTIDTISINGTSIPGEQISLIFQNCPGLTSIVIDSRQRAVLPEEFLGDLDQRGILLITQDG